MNALPRLLSLVLTCLGLIPGAIPPLRAAPPANAVSAELTKALADERTSLMDGIVRGDASAVSGHFCRDATLVVPGFAPISQREGIEASWRFALEKTGLARLVLQPDELSDFGGAAVVETGSFTTFGAGGETRDGGNYLLVWVREDGAWRISRDIVSPGVGPGPVDDRVGYPTDYRERLELLAPPHLSPQGVIATVYGNLAAASATLAGKNQYPNGSILVMEFAAPASDQVATADRKTSGEPQRGTVLHVDVMRREADFGAAYGKNQAGNWEFVSYRPDGGFFTRPARSAACAACHRAAAAASDSVFPLKNRSR
jgi:ketosteroid isomerase-like protein